MNQIGATFVTVLASLVGLAMLAVVVSRRGQAPEVISAGGSALASVIGAAVSPLGGGNQNATNFGASSNNIGGIAL
jgi:hypothetical protein